MRTLLVARNNQIRSCCISENCCGDSLSSKRGSNFLLLSFLEVEFELKKQLSNGCSQNYMSYTYAKGEMTGSLGVLGVTWTFIGLKK